MFPLFYFSLSQGLVLICSLLGWIW